MASQADSSFSRISSGNCRESRKINDPKTVMPPSIKERETCSDWEMVSFPFQAKKTYKFPPNVPDINIPKNIETFREIVSLLELTTMSDPRDAVFRRTRNSS